jgi:M42 glutamyl aminopeptidase
VVDQCSGLDRGLLQELLTTYSPCGQNDAICDVGPRELEPHVEETLGSGRQLVGLIRGGDAPPIRVMAHMDELSMIVKPVEPDHSLHVTQLGSSFREFSEAARSQSSGIARRCAVSSQSDLNTQPKRANGFGRRSPARRQSDGLGARMCVYRPPA